MAVYNYKLLIGEPYPDPGASNDICSEITSHEEQGWEFVSGSSVSVTDEGYYQGVNFVALMRKPK